VFAGDKGLTPLLELHTSGLTSALSLGNSLFLRHDCQGCAGHATEKT
jgi:hypothetical protein